MPSLPETPTWRRDAPRDGSPDGRSEISLDETIPTPAWKGKPKAWLNRTNLFTALIVFLLSIFFLVATLWPSRHHTKIGICCYRSSQPNGWSPHPYIIANLTYIHRPQHNNPESPVLSRAQVPKGHDSLWTVHRPANERTQRHEEFQPEGRSGALHGLFGHLDASWPDVRGR